MKFSYSYFPALVYPMLKKYLKFLLPRQKVISLFTKGSWRVWWMVGMRLQLYAHFQIQPPELISPILIQRKIEITLKMPVRMILKACQPCNLCFNLATCNTMYTHLHYFIIMKWKGITTVVSKEEKKPPFKKVLSWSAIKQHDHLCECGLLKSG